MVTERVTQNTTCMGEHARRALFVSADPFLRPKTLKPGLLALAISVGASGCQRVFESPPTFTTPYQAVVLTNGQIYFGKLEKFGSTYPVLTDVFYVQSQVNPETKQVISRLTRRGKEWHAPERMILNAHHILLVEPVMPDSQVAKLIEKSKTD
jgi:hypothetical protein